MKQNRNIQIEEIVDGLKCPNNYLCYGSGHEKVCEAKDIGLESFLVCLERNSTGCKFSVVFGDVNFCECPLRIYIAKKLKK